jgi:hypothetical protein
VERNEAAYNNAEDFAVLLLPLKSTRPSVYYNWAEAFPVAYHATVEELAQRGLNKITARGA